MKLADLLLNQSLVVQIVWGEQKIEFPSNVVEIQDEMAYITPYLHNGSALQLSITEGAGVVCNVFTDSTVTGQRISSEEGADTQKGIEVFVETKERKVDFGGSGRKYATRN